MDYNHDIVKEYINASKELTSYFKADSCEPPSACKRYNLALRNLRNYLDAMGLKMPRPLYTFNQKDKKTWKYRDCVITGSKKLNDREFVKDVLNEEFMYK
jgi:hypothetical protein